jgi:hypothetical protein
MNPTLNRFNNAGNGNQRTVAAKNYSIENFHLPRRPVGHEAKGLQYPNPKRINSNRCDKHCNYKYDT